MNLKNYLLRSSFFAVLYFYTTMSGAQNVGIGTPAPHASAQLDINSTTRGTLITTMTTSQRNAIASPATGLLVFDINKKTIYLFDGHRWLPMMYSTVDKNPPVMVNPLVGPNDNFGIKVAIDGDYAIVGAPGRTGLVDNSGAAYIYFRNNGVWSEQEFLTADDGATDDFFGSSVSIFGDYAVVGAYGDDIGADANQGSVYIFHRTGTDWSQVGKFTAIDGLANDFFGYSVDIDNNTIVVGAYGDNIGANSNQGSAYVYQLSGANWLYEAKLTASDGEFGDSFGNSVSVSGSYIIVGAFLDDEGANADQGSAYSFHEFTNPGGWTTGQAYHDKLTANDGAAEDYFGVSVSIANLFLVVGASGDDIGTNNEQGSAYTFFRLPLPPYSWGLSAKITAPDGAPNDNFGIYVANSLQYSVIGSYRDDGLSGFSNQGSAYLFTSNSSSPAFRRKIEDDDGDTNGYFGASVAISGFEVIIGAYGKNGGSGQVGFLNVQ
jgi:hypothetical protein